MTAIAPLPAVARNGVAAPEEGLSAPVNAVNSHGADRRVTVVIADDPSLGGRLATALMAIDGANVVVTARDVGDVDVEQADRLAFLGRRLRAGWLEVARSPRTIASTVLFVSTDPEVEASACDEAESHGIPSLPLRVGLSGLAGALLADAGSEEVTAPTALLSVRETEVLAFAGDGLSASDIARQLGVTLGTVRDHLKAVRRKLDCTSTLQAVTRANRLGIIDLT